MGALAAAVCLGLCAVSGRRATVVALLALVTAFAAPVAASPSSIGLTQRLVVGVELAALLALSVRVRARGPAAERASAARAR